ncbi:hypothetical protein B0H14DRAFT_2642277 [Mycena olivaceomarginata]|nr:hypothetical protein B0H14DRAFT_2642277 [Mycena olivaceomarginata]
MCQEIRELATPANQPAAYAAASDRTLNQPHLAVKPPCFANGPAAPAAPAANKIQQLLPSLWDVSHSTVDERRRPTGFSGAISLQPTPTLTTIAGRPWQDQQSLPRRPRLRPRLCPAPRRYHAATPPVASLAGPTSTARTICVKNTASRQATARTRATTLAIRVQALAYQPRPPLSPHAAIILARSYVSSLSVILQPHPCFIKYALPRPHSGLPWSSPLPFVRRPCFNLDEPLRALNAYQEAQNSAAHQFDLSIGLKSPSPDLPLQEELRRQEEKDIKEAMRRSAHDAEQARRRATFQDIIDTVTQPSPPPVPTTNLRLRSLSPSPDPPATVLPISHAKKRSTAPNSNHETT